MCLRSALVLSALQLFITAEVYSGDAPTPPPAAQPVQVRLADKTLVAWVYAANTTQRGGSVLTLIDKAEHFDAIVLGEVAPGKWMAGSDFFRRTRQDQANWPLESARSDTLVQLAITYRGDRVTLFRNGKEYAAYNIGQPQAFGDDVMVLLGLRYIGEMGEVGFFTGAIEDVRIYDTALSAEQIGALAPKKPSDPKPLAWWTFADGKANDLMKRFPASRLEGTARVAGGRLVLDGSGYLWAAKDAKCFAAAADEEVPFDSSVQTLFYKARSQRTGNMWDTWLYFDKGEYYLYYLANARGQWDNISMARSPDGVHWKEIGRVLSKGRGVTWMGTGSTWKSPHFEKDGKFVMNFSEWKGPRQTIFFAESKDLIHWTRLGNEYEFVQDERWYEKSGRWDCIWTVPRPGGGLYGYWTATPKAETGGRFGFGESFDGITWKALAPPRVSGVGEGEVGAIEKIGGKYYMMFGTDGHMTTLMADQPEGPFVAAKQNRRLLAGHTYFSRFFPVPEGLLVNHHSIARDGRVYFGALKATRLDAEGTLRLGWWKGNEKMKHRPIDIIPPADGKAVIAMLQNAFDVQQGVVLEGTLVLPGAGDSARRGLFIECGKNSGVAVLLDSRGAAELGPMQADLTGFKPEKRVNRDMTFGPSVQFRLLLKHSLMEFYVNDILIECFSLPEKATGHIGLLPAGAPAAFTALKAWRAGEPQPADQAEEQKTPPKDAVYSRAAEGTYTVPPELKNFRLLLKFSLIEFYLDDQLIQCYSLPGGPTGRIGFVTGGRPEAFRDLQAWYDANSTDADSAEPRPLGAAATVPKQEKIVHDTPAMPAHAPPTWLTYHLAHPGDTLPGDPNGAFFWKGRYPLMARKS